MKEQHTRWFGKVPARFLLAGVIFALPLLAGLWLLYRAVLQSDIRTDGAGPRSWPAPYPTPRHGPDRGNPVAQGFKPVPVVPQFPVVRAPPRILAGKELRGHDGEVFAAVFASDGRHILSAGEDGTLRLWEVENGKEIARLKGHTGSVRAVAYVGGLDHAASAGEDGTLRLWDLKKRKELQQIQAHRGCAYALAVAAEGHRILTGGADRAMRLWDAASGKQLGEYFGHDGAVLSVAFSPDGKYALSGSADKGVLTWELATGREHNFIRLREPAHVLRFLPDGQRALIGGDWTCCYWDVLSGERWIGPSGRGTLFRGVAVLPGSDYVLTGGADRQLELSRLPSLPTSTDPKHIRSLDIASIPNAHEGTINAIDVTADGSLALTAGADGRIRLWRLEAPPHRP